MSFPFQLIAYVETSQLLVEWRIVTAMADMGGVNEG